MNYLAVRCRHTVVAMDGRFDAAALVEPGVQADYVSCPNTGNPLTMIPRFRKLIAAARPDLLLTYNWGSIDAVAASRLGPAIPVIHTEDGFDVDEQAGQIPRRVWTRRLLLGGVYRVIAPSRQLEQIMTGVWRLPAARVEYLPNGVDTDFFSPVRRQGGEGGPVVVGCVANLTAVKNQSLLVGACAAVARRLPVRLLLAGEGPERPRLEELVGRLGLNDSVEFLGLCGDVRPVYARMDMFVLSSTTEQMPLSVLEAMACGLPIAATAVGDIRTMVSEENREFIVPPEHFSAAFERLAASPSLRRRVGEANRRHCVQVFGLNRMLKRYAELYAAAAGV
jgi:glycosyltransferase involved in cell wall biosynthesis